MSKKDVGHVAANGSSVENYGEKMVVGYTDDGESVSAQMSSGCCARLIRRTWG